MKYIDLINNKRSPKLKKTKESTPTYLSWIKQHVSESDIGREIQDGDKRHPIHVNTIADVVDFFKRLQSGNPTWLHRLNVTKLANHRDNLDTWFFAGASEARKSHSLFLIDVDCKKRGTPEGAKAFLEFLTTEDCQKEYGLSFPHLFKEVSTHGRGGHGFPLLEIGGYGAEVINKLLLHRLTPWLNRIAQEKGFDIENVEIKGTMPEISWGEKKYEVLSYKTGCLAKLPREGERRFDELQKTAVISVDRLLRLPITAKMPKIRNLDNGPVPVIKMKKAASTNFVNGSTSGKHISDDMLAGLEKGGRYRVVAEELFTVHKIQTSGRQVVRVEDVAIALMIGEWLTDHMPTNGAMPNARWEGMWSALKDAGDINRGWCSKRFAVIRNWLSSLELINWEDSNFTVGWYDDEGEYHKGKAAKWRFSDDLMQKLSVEKGIVDEDSETEQNPVLELDQEEEREEERDPLKEQHLYDWVHSLTRQSKNQTIQPTERARLLIYRFSVDEITELIAPFELLAA